MFTISLPTVLDHAGRVADRHAVRRYPFDHQTCRADDRFLANIGHYNTVIPDEDIAANRDTAISSFLLENPNLWVIEIMLSSAGQDGHIVGDNHTIANIRQTNDISTVYKHPMPDSGADFGDETAESHIEVHVGTGQRLLVEAGSYGHPDKSGNIAERLRKQVKAKSGPKELVAKQGKQSARQDEYEDNADENPFNEFLHGLTPSPIVRRNLRAVSR